MATVGPVTSPTNDLRGFLSKSSVERFFHHHQRLQKQPVGDLDPAGPLAFEALAAVKQETGSAKAKSKQEQHSSAFSRFRAKAKPVKSVSVDNRGGVQGRSPATGSTHTSQSSPFGSTGTCDRTEELWLPIEDRGNCLRLRNFEESNHVITDSKRGMVKRSVSALSELTGRGGQSTPSTVHPSYVNGQRLAEWKDPSRFDVGIYDDVIAKRLNVTEQKSRTPSSGKIHVGSKGAAESATVREYLTVLGGSPYGAPETETLTDLSPLIELDRPAFATARNGFDNVATTANSSDGRLQRQNIQSGGQPAPNTTDPPPSAAFPIGKGDGEPGPRQPTTPRAADAKKKRWFPVLRIKIPEDEDKSAGPKLNLKKLSTADERKIEEVLELAGTFGRLGTSDQCPSTPRTPGAWSKESKESPASGTDSPTSHFRFNFFRGRKEEKKTFAEELASHLTDPSGLLTPEALEAYERLVSKGGGETDDPLTKTRLAKPSTRQARRPSLRVKFLQRSHQQRSSMSESEEKEAAICESLVQTKPLNVGSGRLMRFGSTGGMPTTHRALTEPNLFAWFDKHPLNTARSERKGRPKSLQSTDLGFRDGSNAFLLSMPSPSPVIQLPPRGGRDKKAEGGRRLPPPLPPHLTPPLPPHRSTGEDSEPAPAIPPRIPRRQLSVDPASQPRLRKYHQASRGKPRSYSEEMAAVQSMRPDLYDIPRRDVRSTDTSDGALDLSQPQSPSAPNLVSSLHGSDDSVFGTYPRAPYCTNSLARDPASGSSRGTNNFGPYRSMSVKNVKVNAKELGIWDKNDPFWEKKVTLDLSESHSESDLLREALAPIPGRYETSDCISYEDLMEFALDEPQHNWSSYVDSTVCDEIRLMRKMFSNDVTIEDCMDALVETSWNVHHAVKLIKLKQLLGTGLGTQDQCKDALMACNWNVDEAAAFLLPPSTYD